MKKKVFISILTIVLLTAIGAFIVSCDVPSGDTTWEVYSNISGSFKLRSDTDQQYTAYNGETGAEGDVYSSSHKIALESSKDVDFTASVIVTATKDGADVSLDGKTFTVEVIDADGNALSSLKAKETTNAVIRVTFPDLSDESYQGCKFSIKVTLDTSK